MSVKLMGKVFELDLPRPEAWVLMALVDHAAHDGSGIFPSVDLIAWKTGYSRRQVQNIIRSLCARGLLVLVQEARDHRPREYRAELMDAPLKAERGADSARRRATRRARASAPRGVQPCDTGVQGDDKRGAEAIAPESSREPSSQPSGEPSTPTRAPTRKAPSRKTVLPPDFVLSPARTVLITRQGCRQPETAFASFVDYHVAKGSRMADWDAAWRTWSRNHRRFGCACQQPSDRPHAGRESTVAVAKRLLTEAQEGERDRGRDRGCHK